MTDTSNPDTRPAPATPGVSDRRRPGRTENAHPALIPLLREPAAGVAAEERPTRPGTRDELGAARGIALAVLLMLPLWCAIAFALW